MVDITVYTDLITRPHASAPNFMATVTALVQPLVDVQNFIQGSLQLAFDLDTAKGVQLDQVGLWIGRSRRVSIPLNGVYFSWDTLNLGWDQGAWQGAFDPTTGLVSLDDYTYRQLLRAKIILNRMNGTITAAVAALTQLFADYPGVNVSVKDNFDMTMTVGISGVVPPAVLIALLENGELVVAPESVGVSYVITSINGVALFGWDVENSVISGWDVGAWSGALGTGPGQVTGLTIVSVSSNSVTLSWLSPTSGTGSNSYQVQYRIAGSTGPFSLIGQPTTSTVTTIGSLQTAASYEFEVYAVNNAGAGPPSISVVATTSNGAPGQVQNLQGVSSTTTTILLSWSAQGSGGTYTVLSRISGNGTFTTAGTTSATSITLTGLAPSTLYDFEVYVTTAGGTGPTSTPITYGTAGSVPGQIAPLSAVTINATDVVVSGQAPSGAGSFTYHVRYAINTTPVVYQDFTGLITTSGSTFTADITGLQPATGYLFTAYATNASGSGPISAPLSVTTAAAAPGQVGPLTLVSDTTTSATISWAAVPLATSYQVEYQVDGDATWASGPLVTAPTTSATVTGLSAGYTYNFRVTAING